MRIAVVSPFLDRRHGTERVLSEVVERLAREYPCEIHLFANRVEGLAVRGADACESSARARIVWHRVPSISGPHLLQFLYWFFRNESMRRSVSRSAGVPFDVVLSPGINCRDADVVIVHALFHRLRELSTGGVSASGALRKLHQTIYYRLLSWLETRVYENPSVRLAAVSPRTKADLQRYFRREDVVVIPNAVDTGVFSPRVRAARRADARRQFGFAEKEFVLLVIGNDWRVKGLPAILEAMSQLAKLPLRLLVVGGDDAAPFRELARRLAVLERCQWHVPTADVLSLYAAADIYVSPSLEDSFALPVAEAMACGLPAITSRYAGISAFVADGVDAFVLGEPRGAETLAGLIARFYNEPELCRCMGEAAASKAREWSWDRNAAQVWELLQSAKRQN